MDARPKTVTEILQTGTDQFLVPFFQRHYKWTKKEWSRLWQDAVRLLELPGKERHFLGSMVCTPLNLMPGEVNTYQLIDGQQRLTTLTILLAALKKQAEEYEVESLVDQIHEGFLVHKWHKGTDHYRLVPRTGDREVLFGVVEGDPPKTKGSNRIKNAFRYFGQVIAAYVESQDDKDAALRNLFSLITSRLSLVVITIDDENPYEIFWSLNGKGLPLRQSDLIRNFVFMQVPLEDQEEFNSKWWDRLEHLLEETDSDVKINATKFFRNFLMRNGLYIRQDSVFAEFQNQYVSRGCTADSVAKDLIEYADIYRRILEPDHSKTDLLSQNLSRLSKLDQATSHPLIGTLLARHENEKLSLEDLNQCLLNLQSFLIRRSICGETTRQYSRRFVEVIAKLDENTEQSLRDFFFEEQWPDDDAFISALATFDLYRRERKMTALVLAELERLHGSKEAVSLGKSISIEHVMPQNVTSGVGSASWQKSLGEHWRELHKKVLNTLGNLTLTGYNSELSNSSFEKKKKLFVESNFFLNKYFGEKSTWDNDAIVSRGRILAKDVAKIWERPDGKAYTPTSMITRENKVLFNEFWTGFLKVRAEHRPDEKKQKLLTRNMLKFPSKRQRVRYYASIFPDEGTIEVGVFGVGDRGNEFMQALWEETPDELLERLDERHGTTSDLTEAEDDDDYVYMYLSKGDVSFAQADRPQLQATLHSMLEDFQEEVEPIVLGLDLKRHKSADEEDHISV